MLSHMKSGHRVHNTEPHDQSLNLKLHISLLHANVLIRNMLIRRREQRDGLISPPCCSFGIQLAACGQGGISSKCNIKRSGIALLAVLSSRAVYI